MAAFLQGIDARARLAGTNKLEILMFTLGRDRASGRRETYGINVFKVREVIRAPVLTRAPEMPAAIDGMASLRGALVPVLNMVRYTGIDTDDVPAIMILAEYNGQTLGFLVEAVETILRLDWSAMRAPPAMLNSGNGGLVTAVTELADGRLVMMMDVESILEQTLGGDAAPLALNPSDQPPPGHTILFADDSAVARKHIAHTLDALHVAHVDAVNGHHAWQQLKKIADDAERAGKPVRDTLQLILTDVEMPEMDGYMLVKQIKADARFNGIPVVMHSSLSGESNKTLGMSVGADEYVPKFEAQRLAQTLTRLLVRERAPQ
jgi:two-component system chemotaxis response regulator CheV